MGLLTAAAKAALKARDFEAARAIQTQMYAALKAHSDVMAQFPRGAMNLTTDAARATPEWQAASAAGAEMMAELRAFNKVYAKMFAPELRAMRRTRGYGGEPG